MLRAKLKAAAAYVILSASPLSYELYSVLNALLCSVLRSVTQLAAQAVSTAEHGGDEVMLSGRQFLVTPYLHIRSSLLTQRESEI